MMYRAFQTSLQCYRPSVKIELLPCFRWSCSSFLSCLAGHHIGHLAMKNSRSPNGFHGNLGCKLEENSTWVTKRDPKYVNYKSFVSHPSLFDNLNIDVFLT